MSHTKTAPKTAHPTHKEAPQSHQDVHPEPIHPQNGPPAIKITSPHSGETVKSQFEVSGTCEGDAKKVRLSCMYAQNEVSFEMADVKNGKWKAMLSASPNAGYDVVAVIDGTDTDDRVSVRVE